MDPMAEKYYSISPYTYCNNNPVNVIDPDGRDGIAVVDKENRTITINQTFYYNSQYPNMAGQVITQNVSKRGNE
jgi:hypothetical protein